MEAGKPSPLLGKGKISLISVIVTSAFKGFFAHSPFERVGTLGGLSVGLGVRRRKKHLNAGRQAPEQ